MSDPLVELARSAIEKWVKEGGQVTAELPAGVAPEGAGIFVSLHSPDGSLRGCLGTIAATKPTVEEEVVGNAVAAATRDPRFPPLAERELEGLRVKVDVLHPAEEIAGVEELDPKRYGVIVRTEDGRQALLLPDLEGVDEAQQQFRLTCRKAGIHPERDRYRLYRFTVTRHD